MEFVVPTTAGGVDAHYAKLKHAPGSTKRSRTLPAHLLFPGALWGTGGGFSSLLHVLRFTIAQVTIRQKPFGGLDINGGDHLLFHRRPGL